MTFFEGDTTCDICNIPISLYSYNEMTLYHLCTTCQQAVEDAREQRKYLASEAVARVPFPQFELAGPPCQKPGCFGVLTTRYNLKTDQIYQRCHLCEFTFDHPLKDYQPVQQLCISCQHPLSDHGDDDEGCLGLVDGEASDGEPIVRDCGCKMDRKK